MNLPSALRFKFDTLLLSIAVGVALLAIFDPFDKSFHMWLATFSIVMLVMAVIFVGMVLKHKAQQKLTVYVRSQVQKNLRGIEDDGVVTEYIVRHALATHVFLKKQTYEKLDELILDYCLLFQDEKLQTKIRKGQQVGVLLPMSYYNKS